MKNKYFVVFLIASVFASCTSDEDLIDDSCDDILDSTVLTEKEAFFFDLVFDQEFGDSSERLRKWNGPIRIFVEGTPDPESLNELNTVVSESNALSTFLEITLVNDIASSNLRFFFGTKEDYVALVEPSAFGIAEGNRGFVTIAWNSAFEINRASICIDNTNFPDLESQQHAIREELAQSLGLINDITSDENSIFHQTINTNRSYSERDEEVIALMLGNDLSPGLCPSSVLQIVE